ncbi:MAG: hypothetical protein JWN63_3421 [Candidatus Acidoferrum typicum]|nr:hypothetical protein [Candidatus Acidoferrum typicum]
MNVDPMQVKLALRRLEDLYLEGAKWGADLMHQKSVEVLSSDKANGHTSNSEPTK